jgi:hypothetical protein
MLTPRSAVDTKGQFAVSRSPYLVTLDEAEEETLLKFFVAVLNSSVSNWFMRNFAPKYSRGYSRVEANLLRTLPVPDFGRLNPADVNRIVGLVDKLQSGRGAGSSLEMQVDIAVAEIYGFNVRQRQRLLGLD